MNHRNPSSLADAYGRYAALIGSQIEAIERGDFDAVEPIARMRDDIAAEIVSLPPADADDSAARRQLESCLQADLRLRRRLESLQADVRNATRRLDQDRAGLRVYTGAGAGGSSVDVSL
jgi:hypothetical protein